VAQLRTVVLGLTGCGADLCAAIRKDPGLDLAAVADRDKSLAERKSQLLGVPSYDDYRLAIIEESPQVLLMALPPYERSEYLKLAASRQIAVLASGPPLSDFDLTLEHARAFSKGNVPFSVCRIWQPEPAYGRLGSIDEWAGGVFSAHVNVLAPAGDLDGWRGDSARAGGVLLNDAYDQLDAIVSVMGMPEEVYAVLARPFAEVQTRPHDSEDAATVMMRFSSNRVATICARRAGREHYWRYRLHGAQATVVITVDEMVETDVNENTTSTSKVQTRNRLAPAVGAFSAALAAGHSQAPSPIEEHLVTMAVIQTAYLSAKTGQPESPGKVFCVDTGLETKHTGARTA